MALTVTHPFVSTIPEGSKSGTPGGEVGPVEWNATHTVSGTIGDNLTFYVNGSTGSDSNDGLTPATAWKTISKVNASTFSPGVSILFAGGQTFSGAIVSPSAGTPAAPITFGSYGGGQATISSGTSNGFTSTNQAGIVVRNLTFTGSASTNIGIHFNNTLGSNVHLQNIQVINCNVSGYGWSGIHADGNNGYAGYDDVLFDGCTATNCSLVAQGLANIGTAGIQVCSNTGYGLSSNPPTFNNVKIVNCISHDNPGTTDTNLNGNGFFMAQTNLGIIDKCLSYSNGGGAGSAGCYGYQSNDSTNITIKSSVAHDNTGSTINDGGGFSYDGGSVGCIFLDCLAYNNKGAGYSVQSYTDGLVTGSTGDSIINCVSINDGTGSSNHNQAGLFVDNDFIVTGLTIAGCKVYQSNASGNVFQQIGTAASSTTGLVTGCTFTINGTQNFVNTLGNPTGMLFEGNVYNSAGAFHVVWNSATHLNILSWQETNSQETSGQTNSILNANSIVQGANPALILSDTETHGQQWGISAEVIGTTSMFNLFGGVGTHTAWVTNYDGHLSFQLVNGAVYGWSSNASDADSAAMDTGISRTGAAAIAFGNGTPGDASAALSALTLTLNDSGTNILLNLSGANGNGVGMQFTPSGAGTHAYQFFSTGTANGPGVFGIFDVTASLVPLAIDDSGSQPIVATIAGGVFAWSAATQFGGAPYDLALAKKSSGILKVTNGSSGYGAVDASGYSASGTAGISATITTAKITPVSGANGSMTFVNGILTAQTQAT